MDNLPELRDIHFPQGVSFFPPAYGWWVVLFGVLAAVVLFQFVKVLIKRSKKRYALKLIDEIGTGNAVEAAMQMSEVLRRICVYKYKSAAALYGREWTQFLNEKCSVKLDGKAEELFLNAPYMDVSDLGVWDDFSSSTHDHPHQFSNASKLARELASPLKGEEEIVVLKEFCRVWIGENL